MTLNRAKQPPAARVKFAWPRVDEPRWVESASAVAPLLLVGWEGASYEPLREEPALFRKFAALKDTRGAYEGFACAYGVPGGATWAVSTGETTEGGEALCYPVAYSFNWWQAERHSLAFAVHLWDALRAGNAETVLGECVATGPNAEGSRDVLTPWADGGKYRACGTVPRNSSPEVMVRTALANTVSLFCSQEGVRVALAVVSGPSDTPDGVGLRLTFQVASLLGAMWLQFALAIDGNRRYETCPVCGDWWDATASRADRETCSDRCRQARSRAPGKPDPEGKE